MQLRQRRVVSRFIQISLIALAVGIAIAWVARRVPETQEVRMQFDPPALTTLGAGDVQVYNVDSTLDLVLLGDKIYAGLSPQMVAKVREKLARESGRDTSGFGGAIATLVKQQVSEKIAARIVYDVHDISDIRYDEPNLVFEWRSGREQRPFEKIQIDGNRNANRFTRAEAERFISAVKARQRELRR